MKLNGTHKFKATSAQVFQAILTPEVLKSSIAGCDTATFVDANTLQISITTPIPGLKGPYLVSVNIVRRDAPNALELQVVRKGRGGSINAVSQITLTDEADGALLAYNANAELEGLVASVNNPVGQGIVKNSLNNFFKNVEKSIA
jgi:carbon monoxide dehydrogenase subunit G